MSATRKFRGLPLVHIVVFVAVVVYVVLSFDEPLVSSVGESSRKG